MGTDIRGGGHSFTVGGGGFFNLRKQTAEAADAYYRCGGALSAHYALLASGFSFSGESWEKYDRETDEIRNRYGIPSVILLFLYSPDDEAELPAETAPELLKVLEGKKSESNFGYVLQPVTLDDFRTMLGGCVKKKEGFGWI